MAQPLTRLALSRSGVDRAAHRRTDELWLADAWAKDSTLVLPVAGGRAPVAWTGDDPRLVFVTPGDAPAGERYLLGVDAEDRAYFAVAVVELPDGEAAGLREVGTLLDARDAGLLVHAMALENWHRAHPFCARCGAATEVGAAGHVRRCPREGSEHYPRTDPAVIMSVVDDAGRILLGHQARWPERRFSTLAGFVEPGESLEQAVCREVLEETGVLVGETTYLGSQAWPFPSSLMLGFTARALSTDVLPDGVEIAEAGWFRREDLARLVPAGEVLLPPPVSIARHLIEQWYGEPIDDGSPGWR